MTAPEPLFLEGRSGRLFALHVPAAGADTLGVVLLPPFAEEMNRSRRMLRRQATALAQAGISALLLDPLGTGDSAGDFADAHWERWVEDVGTAAAALCQRGAVRIGLFGLRLGALLAAAAAPTLPAPCFATALWQPVVSGRAHLAEFLRLRTLPGAVQAAAGETIELLAARLASGTAVEVAGYEVSPELAGALNGLGLAALADPALGPVIWCDLVPLTGLPAAAASSACIAVWRAAGLRVASSTVVGPAFWGGQGPALVPELIDVTTAALSAAARSVP